MSKMRIGVFVTAFLTTSLIVGAPAHADNATVFLDKVSAQGINIGDSPPDVQLTLATATAICQQLRDGYTPEVAGRQIYYQFPGSTAEQAAGFVAAAQETICVQTNTPLEPGW